MGPEIVRRLIARGHDVSDPPSARSARSRPGGSQPAGGPQRPGEGLGAGRTGSGSRRCSIWRTTGRRARPPTHVEAAARSCGDRLQRYVFMSSIAAYGPGLDHRESDPLAPDDSPNPYVQHKVTAEQMLFRMHAASGFPVVTFRPPFVHGPHQPFYREQFFWDRLLDRRPIILPDGGEGAMAVGLRLGRGGGLCAGHGGRPRPRARRSTSAMSSDRPSAAFVEMLARVAGVEATLVPVPRDTIVAAGGQFAGPSTCTSASTSICRRTPRMSRRRSASLGVTPTPLEAALRDGFNWYRTQPRRPTDYAFEDRLLASVDQPSDFSTASTLHLVGGQGAAARPSPLIPIGSRVSIAKRGCSRR